MCDLHHPDEGIPRRTGITDLVDELVVCLTNSRIYWAKHPRVQSSIENLEVILQARCDASSTGVVDLGAADGYLFHEKQPLLGASLSAARIIEPLSALSSGGIRFKRGADQAALLALVELLGSNKDVRRFDEANEVLRAKGCHAIELLPEYGESAGAGPHVAAHDFGLVEGDADQGLGEPSPTTVDIPVAMYQSIVDSLQDIMVRACRGETFDIAGMRGHVETVLTQLHADPAALMRVCRYEHYDAFTFGHSIRVCAIALQFARQLTNDPALLERVGMSALLHDVGKAWVPFEILYSRGRLSDEEREEMNKHTQYGSEILLGLPDNDPMAVATAYNHHKRTGKSSSDTVRLSTVTRIVKIADVFEALTAVRPYKDRMSALRAYRIMMSMGDHFDGGLLRRFIQLHGVYPDGCRVLLDTGETARVVRQSSALQFPVVEIEEPMDSKLSAGGELKHDLSTFPTGEMIGITEQIVTPEDDAEAA